MTMTVLCKWSHALDCLSAIQGHYFSLFAVSAEWQSLQVTGHWGWAWMNSFQAHTELPGRSFSRAIRVLRAQTLMQTDLLCCPRVLVPCSLLARDGSAAGCVGQSLPHFVRSFVSTFWQHFLGHTHVAPTLAGRQGWTGSGQGMIWFGFGHGSQFSGGAGHCPCSCSHSPGLFSAWEAGDVCCVPYAVFRREVVHGRATSFVTVVALNRKWLIFHDYFSGRHDSWENASVWLAVENEPALLSFKWKCSQALHANIAALDESSLAAWLMLYCQYVSAKVCTAVLETSVSLISLASYLPLCLCLVHL